MAKAKKSAPRRRAKSVRKKGKRIRIPSLDVLAGYVPTDAVNAHPAWVRTNFPSYIDPHAGHETTSVRQFAHAGHSVRIITSYRIEVDGKPVRAHLSVDEDGRVYTHATPFVTYDSAVNLMRAVLDNYPESFLASGSGHGPGHHGHGRGGGHQ